MWEGKHIRKASIFIYKGKSTRLRSVYILLNRRGDVQYLFMEGDLIFIVHVDGV